MESRAKNHLHAACRRLLRPIVAMLLDGGMTWKEFSELSRTSFVEVASERYGRRGRPTNVSRIAILTGLGRREVMRQREKLNGTSAPTPEITSYAARVLSGWHQDATFQGHDGGPAPLALDGAEPTFRSLVHCYAGDIPPVAMLKELRAGGAVEEDDDGRLRAVKRYFTPSSLDGEAVLRAGSVLNDLGSTVHHNLAREGTSPARFEGRATSTQLAAGALPALRELTEEKAQSFLEAIDAWLTSHEADDDSSRPVRAGVGIYLIEDLEGEDT